MSEDRASSAALARLNKTKSYWSGFSLPVRAAILLSAVAAITLLLTMAFGGLGAPRMEILFSRLEPLQAKEVAARLDELAVPYEVGDQGSSILVPAEQRDRLRLQLSPDVYAQGMGFSLFENGGFLMSDFERRVQWQIALEEELRRTITTIDAVEQARVHLVIPQDELFVQEKGSPSASIILRLTPLSTLSDSQVRGILSLVAGSVEGLKPENITIIDARGNVLYDAFAMQDQGVAFSATDRQMQLTRQFERELENRLRSLLGLVFGPGRAVAMVSAELDFNTLERTVITYDTPVNRSRQRIEERHEGTGAIPGGEVGEENIPGYEAQLGTGGEYSSERIEETVNYEIGETKEFMASAPGQLQRLSAAVIVDEGSEPGQVDQVTTLIANAIGFDAQRGDSISVQLVPFDTSWREDPALEPPGEATPAAGWPWQNLAVIAAAAVFLVVLLAFFLRRSRQRRVEEEKIFQTAYLPEPLEDKQLSAEQSKHDQLRQFADEKPETVAQVIQAWLAENRR